MNHETLMAQGPVECRVRLCRDCKNREPASQEAALNYLSTILAGIGAFSFVMAIVIWSVK